MHQSRTRRSSKEACTQLASVIELHYSYNSHLVLSMRERARERAKVGFVPIWNSRLQTIAAAVCNVNGTAYRHSGSQRYSPMRRYVRSFIHPRQRRKMLTAFKATLIVYSDGLAIFRTVGYMRLAVPYTQQDDYSPWHGPRLFHSPAISKICCEREAEKRILMTDQKWQLGWPSFDHHCWPRRTRNVAKDRR